MTLKDQPAFSCLTQGASQGEGEKEEVITPGLSLSGETQKHGVYMGRLNPEGGGSKPQAIPKKVLGLPLSVDHLPSMWEAPSSRPSSTKIATSKKN